MKILLSILVSLIINQFSLSFKCGHDSIFKNNTIKTIDIRTKKSKLRNLESTYHPIVFHIDYSSINRRNIVNPDYIKKIETALTHATQYLSELLEVKNDYQVKIDSPTSCDIDLIYSPQIVVDADIVIYPIIQTQRELGESVVAAARACLKDSTNRPIAGLVYLGSEYDFSKKNADKYLEIVLMHEISHILAFSSSLFDFFPNQPVYQKKVINGVERTLLTSPQVVKMARKHFGCENLTGVELENQGGQGSASSHWEGRVMLGDYMISTDYDEIVISDITLAVFEDSGWYKVHYYTGDLFRFGKNQGCSFLEDKCVKNGVATFKKEFCTKSRKEMCFPGNMNKGICFISDYVDPLPEEYQYFNVASHGGFMPADYCPVPNVVPTPDYYFKTHCKYGETGQYPSELEEEVSDSSICIESSLTKKDIPNINKYRNVLRPICHQITCDKEKEEIVIKIGSTFAHCPKNASDAVVVGYEGVILCPDYSRICEGSKLCNDLFDCIIKKSLPPGVVDEVKSSSPPLFKSPSSSSSPSTPLSSSSSTSPSITPPSSSSQSSSSLFLHSSIFINILIFILFI